MSVSSDRGLASGAGAPRGLEGFVWTGRGRALISVCIGIVGAWLLRQPLTSLLLDGKLFSNRSLMAQLGILVLGAAAFSLVTAGLLASYASPSQEARRWLVFALPVLFWAAMVWIGESDLSTLRRISIEDGPLEWQQFFFDALCVILLFIASRRMAREPGRAKWGLLAAAVVFFFIAGEEISWAQRVFGFGTPADLAKINMQDEFNVHNIVAINNEQTQYYTVLGLTLGLAWLLYRRIGRALLSVLIGIAVAWLLWDAVLPIVFPDPASSGSSLFVPIAITAVGGVAAAVVSALLLPRIQAKYGGLLGTWLIPPWYLSSYFLLLAVIDVLWWVRAEPSFMWGVFRPWLNFLNAHLAWDYEATLESVLAAGWLLAVLRVWQLATNQPAVGDHKSSLPADA